LRSSTATPNKSAPRGDGLGRKNRLRLAPLRDPKNLVRLFLLPGKICKEIEAKKKVLRDDALLMQLAVALLILTTPRCELAICPAFTSSTTCVGRD
jgi:hypothetical protein